MPDLYKIGAPYLFFFHIGSNHKLAALANLFKQSRKYDFWKPSLLEYATFWIKREKAMVKTRFNVNSNSFVSEVSNGFPGLTLVAVLPQDAVPSRVIVNGRAVGSKRRWINGRWLVFPVLESAGNSVVEVQIQ